MPPKQKISKEMILAAAFKVIQEKGLDNVNARNIAAELNSSTQPLFSKYASMDELKMELYDYAENYYNQYAMERAAQGENFFRKLGHAYLDFAKNDKNVFKFLFMSEYVKMHGFSDMLQEDNLAVARIISKNLEISFEDAKKLFTKTWIFMHGIAAMIATSSITLIENEAENMLKEAYDAFLLQVRNK